MAAHGEDFRYHSALARAHESLSDLQRRLARLADAERHLVIALRIREALAARDPANVGWQQGLAANWSKRGDARRAQGDEAAALERYGEAARIYEQLARHDPANMVYAYHLALLDERVAGVHAARGEHGLARDAARRARTRLVALLEREPTNAKWVRALGTVTMALADAHVALGEGDEALRVYGDALALYQDVTVQLPEQDAVQHNLAVVLGRIADVHLEEGRSAEAVDLYARAAEVYRQLVEKAPGDPDRQRALGLALTDLGDALFDHGDLPAARSRYEAAIGMLEPIAAPGMPRADWHHDLAVAHDRLAGLLESQGEDERALAHRRAALESQVAAAALDAACEAPVDYLRRALRALELRTGQRPPESAADHLVVAYARFERKAYLESTVAFEAALQDPDVRDDLERCNLYNAACCAARAHESATGADAERLASLALDWLAGDLALRRARLTGPDFTTKTPEQQATVRAQVQRELDWARYEDPDLASLRDRPAFQHLFEEDGGE